MDRDNYRRVARWYDGLFEPLNAGLRDVGIKMHPPTEGMRVLDIGCGTGAHLDLYQKAGCEVSGIDSSPAMLEVARGRLGGRADLRAGNATRLPYADGQFDLIVCMLVLHELPPATRTAVLNEAHRTLDEAGRMLLIDFHPGPLRGLKGWWSKAIITLSEFVAGGEHWKNYREFMAKKGLPSLLSAHDLSVDKERVVAGGNFALYLLRSR